MARSAVDSLRHWRYPGTKQQVSVFNTGTFWVHSNNGQQGWYAFSLLKQSIDASSFSNILYNENRTEYKDATTTRNVPYSLNQLNSWNHSHKALRETTELCFTNQQNTDAMVDIYVVRSIHPLSSPATTLLLLNREYHSVTPIFDNTSGTYRSYDNTATANVEPQYNIFNAAALWKHFQLVETRHFRVKAGAHYTSRFSCTNEHISGAWYSQTTDNTESASKSMPGELYALIRIHGPKLTTGNIPWYADPNYLDNAVGWAPSWCTVYWRNEIIWQRPPPFQQTYTATTMTDIFDKTHTKIKFVPSVNTLVGINTKAYQNAGKFADNV